MAEKKAPKTQRGKPWSQLRNAMVAIGKPAKDAEEIAWAMWFEVSCPKVWAVLGDEQNKQALQELYEQSCGKFVDDEEKEGEETPPEKE